MSEQAHWKNLPAGPPLRRIIADALGWHMRKIWVGSRGIEYDFLVYDQYDTIVYQRAIMPEDLHDEEATTEDVWLAAVQDEDAPFWDEDLDEAEEIVFRYPYKVWEENGGAIAWVHSEAFTAQAETPALALVRAWLTWHFSQNA